MRNDRRPAFAERIPTDVHTYFIRCPAAEYAIQREFDQTLSSRVRVWPARL